VQLLLALDHSLFPQHRQDLGAHGAGQACKRILLPRTRQLADVNRHRQHALCRHVLVLLLLLLLVAAASTAVKAVLAVCTAWPVNAVNCRL
jgi:hypothetical protein